jgi:Fur family iron response transcriptional regulator
MVYRVKRPSSDRVETALQRLKEAGLKLTGARQCLVELLYDAPGREFTPAELQLAARDAGVWMGRPALRRVLRDLERAGLVTEVLIDRGVVFYEARTERHYHVYIEPGGALQAIPASPRGLAELPRLLGEWDPARLDVVIRVRVR